MLTVVMYVANICCLEMGISAKRNSSRLCSVGTVVFHHLQILQVLLNHIGPLVGGMANAVYCEEV